VLYFDVFGHPLTFSEIDRFCGHKHNPSSEMACDQLLNEGILQTDGKYVFVPGRQQSIHKRREGARRAEMKWHLAEKAASLLGRFPFVRGVMLTGGMSKLNISEGSDIDFLLIIEPDRIWLAKTLLQIWRKSLPLPLRECFCTNYLISESNLLIDEHNMFTAIELATAVPMKGPKACTQLLETNAWAGALIPGYGWTIHRAGNAPSLPPRIPARLLEKGLGKAGRRLDRMALKSWDNYWNRKYSWIETKGRNKRFKRRNDIATNHLNDFQSWVLDEWVERLAQHGVALP